MTDGLESKKGRYLGNQGRHFFTRNYKLEKNPSNTVYSYLSNTSYLVFSFTILVEKVVTGVETYPASGNKQVWF